MNEHSSRRKFIKTSLGAAAALSAPVILPASAWSKADLPGDRINIGVIGIGKQGSGLLWGFLNTPAIHVAAVCEVDRKKLFYGKNQVEKYYAGKLDQGTYKGCDIYGDFRELIERKDIDAVVIAVPDHWHAIISIEAAKAGKDIYCEKPLSLTIAEARQMVNAVRRYNRVFQTGSMQRSDSKFRLACELVQNGFIGEVESVRVSIRTGFIPHPIICDLGEEPKPEELNWEMWLGPAPDRPYHSRIAPPIEYDGWPHWRDYRDYSGGGMTDWGAHHFDIAQWGLGMDNSGPVEVTPPDGKNVPYLTYRYKNGVRLTTDFEDNLILFTGTEGTVEVNRQYLKTTPEHLVNSFIKPGMIHLYNSNNHIMDWIDCIRTRSKPICDVEIGCRSVTVCHLGNIAKQLNRTVHWDPVAEQFVSDPEANRTLSRAKKSPWRI
ncbi:Gfo/Idh/MocA family oxidoreductase [candidate division KSB1 bacterium]|nr:Gfo/Idh/MocA family oxidoreductase [candidate division KSB1 bacterium]